jgi:hypothetical protein
VTDQRASSDVYPLRDQDTNQLIVNVAERRCEYLSADGPSSRISSLARQTSRQPLWVDRRWSVCPVPRAGRMAIT